MNRPPSDHDRIIVAWLHGAASRHATWREPVGEARRAAVDELKEIAGGRADLLAETAGILLGYRAECATYDHQRIAANLLIEAGADLEAVERWIPVGRERGERTAAPLSLR